MPHSHEQDHNADGWTNIGAVGEVVSSFVSNSYWLGGLFDLATGLPAEALGLSSYGIAFGVVAAVLSAGGATYAHRILNIGHQSKSHAPSPQRLSNMSQSAAVPILTSDANGGYESLQNNVGADSPTLLTPPPAPLRKGQKLALIGDYISHVGEISGPITFVANLATNNSLSRLGKMIIQGSATLFGGLASVANVRTCKEAMLKANRLTS